MNFFDRMREIRAGQLDRGEVDSAAERALFDVVGDKLMSALHDEILPHEHDPKFLAEAEGIAESAGKEVQALVGNLYDEVFDVYGAYVSSVAIVRGMTPDSPLLSALYAAGDEYRNKYVYPRLEELRAADYAPGVTDLFERVMKGASSDPPLDGPQFLILMRDIELFTERLARHEFTPQQAERLIEVFSKSNKLRDKLLETMEKLKVSFSIYPQGPVHLVALEAQFDAYRYNTAFYDSSDDFALHSLQTNTLETLRIAQTYCWAPSTIEAVAAAAESLPEEAAFNPTSLGDLSAHGTAGFWWFTQPVPIKTSEKTGEEEPVVALLWRREPGIKKPERHPFDSKVWLKELDRVWLQTMVLQPVHLADKKVKWLPVPSTAWFIADGVDMKNLKRFIKEGYKELYPDERQRQKNIEALEYTGAAAEWFSRFFLSAASWLRQRVVTNNKAEGVRQVARRLQREYRLDETPRVTVVELRRRDVASRAEPAAPGEKRNFSCRFVVHGHFRNQWYASRNEHAPKWIDAYVKGPSDKPLRTATRVFSVRQ